MIRTSIMITRRRLLYLAGSSAVALALGVRALRVGSSPSSEDSGASSRAFTVSEVLTLLFGAGLADAAAIGAKWERVQPGPAVPPGDVPLEVQRVLDLWMSAGDAREAMGRLVASIDAEFAASDTRALHGWQLAPTELAACRLASLLQADPQHRFLAIP